MMTENESYWRNRAIAAERVIESGGHVEYRAALDEWRKALAVWGDEMDASDELGRLRGAYRQRNADSGWQWYWNRTCEAVLGKPVETGPHSGSH